MERYNVGHDYTGHNYISHNYLGMGHTEFPYKDLGYCSPVTIDISKNSLSAFPLKLCDSPWSVRLSTLYLNSNRLTRVPKEVCQYRP